MLFDDFLLDLLVNPLSLALRSTCLDLEGEDVESSLYSALSLCATPGSAKNTPVTFALRHTYYWGRGRSHSHVLPVSLSDTVTLSVK